MLLVGDCDEFVDKFAICAITTTEGSRTQVEEFARSSEQRGNHTWV